MEHILRKELADLRKNLGFSQQQVAEKAFISQHAISQYETGKREMTLSMFAHLLAAMGVTFSYAFQNEKGVSIMHKKIRNDVPKEPIDFRSIRTEEGFRLWALQQGTEDIMADINDAHFIVFKKTQEEEESGALFWLDLDVFDRSKLIRICIQEDIEYEEL